MWVIIVPLGLIAVLVLILCVPLELAFNASLPGRSRFRFKLLWFFGLVGKEMGGREKPEEKAAPKKQKPKKRKRRFKDIFVLLRTKGLFKQFNVFISDLWHCFRIRDLNADIRVGLGSPDDTGLLFAFIGPSVFWLNSTFPLRVNVQPAFGSEATFEGNARVKVRLRPIKLLIPLSRFLFSPAAFRLLRNYLASRWKRKKK